MKQMKYILLMLAILGGLIKETQSTDIAIKYDEQEMETETEYEWEMEGEVMHPWETEMEYEFEMEMEGEVMHPWESEMEYEFEMEMEGEVMHPWESEMENEFEMEMEGEVMHLWESEMENEFEMEMKGEVMHPWESEMENEFEMEMEGEVMHPWESEMENEFEMEMEGEVMHPWESEMENEFEMEMEGEVMHPWESEMENEFEMEMEGEVMHPWESEMENEFEMEMEGEVMHPWESEMENEFEMEMEGEVMHPWESEMENEFEMEMEGEVMHPWESEMENEFEMEMEGEVMHPWESEMENEFEMEMEGEVMHPWESEMENEFEMEMEGEVMHPWESEMENEFEMEMEGETEEMETELEIEGEMLEEEYEDEGEVEEEMAEEDEGEEEREGLNEEMDEDEVEAEEEMAEEDEGEEEREGLNEEMDEDEGEAEEEMAEEDEGEEEREGLNEEMDEDEGEAEEETPEGNEGESEVVEQSVEEEGENETEEDEQSVEDEGENESEEDEQSVEDEGENEIEEDEQNEGENETEENGPITPEPKEEEEEEEEEETITPMPPRAIITNGDSSHLTTTAITLLGSNSKNPENDDKGTAGLTFEWTCYTDTQLQQECTTLAKSTSMDLSIPASTLTEGIYYFRLTVTQTSTSQTANARASLTLVAPGKPMAKIIGGGAISPTKNIKIYVKHDEEDTGTDFTYIWTISPALADSFATGSHFTIMKDKIEESKEYTLTCVVTNSEGGSTTLIASIHAAKKVTAGTVSASPAEGTGMETQFTITVSGYQPGEGTAISYKYLAEVEGGAGIIDLTSDFGVSKSHTTKLPLGKKANDYKVWVIVVGQNQNSMRARARFAVKVSPKEGGYSAAFIKSTIETGTTEEKISNLNLVASMSTEGAGEVTKGECGKCSTEFGTCDTSTKVCGCATGYEPPDCSLTTEEKEKNKEVLKAILDGISALLDDVNTTGTDLLSLLAAASVSTEGASMGDEETNKVGENMEDKFLKKLEEGKLSIEDAGDDLLKMMSNNMGGLSAEKSTGGDAADLQTRQEEKLGKVSKVAKMYVKNLPAGTDMVPIVTDEFEVMGRADSAEKLAGVEFTDADGKTKVKLPTGLGADGDVLGISVIVLSGNQHINLGVEPIAQTVEVSLTKDDQDITVDNLQDPTLITFTKSSTTTLGSCVFFDNGSYSSKGLLLVSETDTEVVCSTDHHTEFTLIPRVEEEEAVKDTGSGDDDGLSGTAIGLIVASVILLVILIVVGGLFYWRKRQVIYILYYISL